MAGTAHGHLVLSLVRRADLDGLHAGFGFSLGLVDGIAADHSYLRRGRLRLRDRAFLRLDVLHHVERLRERRCSKGRHAAATNFILSSSSNVRKTKKIAICSRSDRGTDSAPTRFEEKPKWEDRMEGRREARIVGLGITAVYVCMLLAAWGSS
jgi:hypothetical protein